MMIFLLRMTISNEKSCLSYIFHSKNGNLRTESILKVKKGRKFKPSSIRIEPVDKSEIQNMYMKHPMMTLKHQKN